MGHHYDFWYEFYVVNSLTNSPCLLRPNVFKDKEFTISKRLKTLKLSNKPNKQQLLLDSRTARFVILMNVIHKI